MAHKRLRFTDEELTQANNVNLMDYAISIGLELKKVGKDSYHIEGYGGLYINPILNKWNCFSKGEGGGPIQFVMFIENKTWVESVKQLLGFNPITNHHKQYSIAKRKTEEKGEFILPEKSNTYKHVIAYLIKTRKIDKNLVYKLIKEGKLYEDKNKNCVFVGYDNNNNPRYGNLRSTNTNTVFKGDVKNSDKAYPFAIEGTSDKVYVCESPIEVLSYLTILKLYNINSFNHHIISLGGVSDKALKQYLEDNPMIRYIVLCLNNDKTGIKATNKIRSGYKNKYNVIEQYPINKDYNEDLINTTYNQIFTEKNVFLRRGEEEKFNLEL